MEFDRAEQDDTLFKRIIRDRRPPQSRVQRFPSPLLSLLKHRIIRLWSALDIDIQVIAEVSKHEPRKYRSSLNDMLSDKEYPQFYRKKLALLWNMIAKDSLVEIEAVEVETLCGRLGIVLPKELEASNEFLADGNAIVDLITERRENGIQTTWTKLLRLCGLEPQNQHRPFQDIVCIPQSAILRFMCYLDCLIQKCQNDEMRDGRLEKLTDIEHRFFKSMDADLKTLDTEIQIIDFHHWLNELSETLDDLKSPFPSDDS